jgi:hypothetical protein
MAKRDSRKGPVVTSKPRSYETQKQDKRSIAWDKDDTAGCVCVCVCMYVCIYIYKMTRTTNCPPGLPWAAGFESHWGLYVGSSQGYTHTHTHTHTHTRTHTHTQVLLTG